DDEGNRSAGEGCIRADRRFAGEDGGCQDARGNDSSRQSTERRSRTPAGRCRELSSAAVERELQPSDGRALWHGKSDRRRAHALQRTRPGLQHLAAAVSVQHYGEHLRLQGVPAVQRAASGPTGPESQLRSYELIMSIAEFLLPEFDREMTTTRTILE